MTKTKDQRPKAKDQNPTDEGQRTNDDGLIPLDAVGTAEAIQKYLELTPEKLAQIRVEQAQLAERRSLRARLNADERLLQRGKELELHHLQTGDKDNLAEALALQGRYREAAQMATRADLKAHYEEFAEAIETDDAMCGCDPFHTENGLRLPNQTDEFRGFTNKHNKTVPFIRCHQCGRLNARAPLAHLEELRRVRNDAVRTRREVSTKDILGRK